VVRRIDDEYRRREVTCSGWSMWLLVPARGQHDLPSPNRTRRSGQNEAAVVTSAKRRDGRLLANRRPKAAGVIDQVTDDVVPGHEPARVVAFVVPAGQLHRPIGDHQAEAVPPPTPRLTDPAAVEPDMLDACLGQLVAQRQPRLTCADHRDVNGFAHKRIVSSLGCNDPSGPATVPRRTAFAG